MKYLRTIFKEIKNSKKSILLLGPRQTGKSTLLKDLKPDLVINLADESVFLRFSAQPDLLKNLLAGKRVKTVFIDEVQRIPSLLNTIQSIIDEDPTKNKFYLSGSSARKLRRGKANLLPGRLISFTMTPLNLEELNYNFDLNQLIAYGTLPGILAEADNKVKRQILNSYSATYLKEEVQAEALTKNIEGFSRFLFVVASKNGQFVDFAKLGSLAGITQKTATRFFEILEDTLIITRVNSFAKSDFRRLIQHPKFYFFDTGVLNALLGNFRVSEDRAGELFETFVFNQLQSFFASNSLPVRVSTYRTEAGAEIDLILESEGSILAVEIKASKNVGKSDLRSFGSFGQVHLKPFESIVIYQGSDVQKIEGIPILPVVEAFKFINQWIKARA